MDLLSMGLIFVVMIVAMYFLMIRPANKRMKEQQAKVEAIQPGTRVVLTSGIFATVRHTGEKQMVVELAPDCVVTVLKAAVARTADADEEEFEYDDEPVVAEPMPPAPTDAALPGQLPSEGPTFGQPAFEDQPTFDAQSGTDHQPRLGEER